MFDLQMLMKAAVPHVKPMIEAIKKTQDEILSKNATDEIAKIIVTHSLGAAAAGVASAIPGVGGTAALLACVGFIWSMYYRINKCLGLELSKVLLKSLASAVITNIAASAASVIGGTVAVSALSFIPGFGTVAATVVMAAIDYAVVFASGLIYIKLLTNLFKAGKDPSKMTEAELKAAASSAVKSEDISKIVKDAKKSYTAGRKSGDISGKETIDLENED